MDTAMKDYRARWLAVQEIERQELRNATFELRWRQLNAVIGMAIGLGVYKTTEDETKVYQRWANLKNQLPTT